MSHTATRSRMRMMHMLTLPTLSRSFPMALFILQRNQAFPDHAGKAGDVIEVANPSDEAWKALIDKGILVAKPDEKPADDESSESTSTAVPSVHAEKADEAPAEAEQPAVGRPPRGTSGAQASADTPTE